MNSLTMTLNWSMKAGQDISPMSCTLIFVKARVKGQARNLQLVKEQVQFVNCIPLLILLEYQRERKFTEMH